MDKGDLCYTSASEMAGLIRRREISPVELMQVILTRIENIQPQINAFAAVCGEEALKDARDAEARIMRGNSVGPLHGIPFSVKDNLWTKGMRTTFGSYIFENFVPDEDAPCVERLKEAGGILIGKTTLPELFAKVLTDSPLLGVTRNPWKFDRTPGGSSGGAGAAVAAGLGPLAVGADGGGSNRIPASCTGIVGLKPTFGLVPYPQAPDLFGNLSTIGPMTRSVSDAALMLYVMAGPDARDPSSYCTSKEHYQSFLTAKVAESLKGCKIAWSPTLGNTEVDREVLQLTEAAVKIFANFGCELEETRPNFDSVEIPYITIFYSGLACRFGEYVEVFREKMDPSILYSIEKGSQYRAMDLQKAIYMRTKLFQTIQRFFKKFDLLITPTLSAPALPVNQNALEPVWINAKMAGSLRGAWNPYTYPFNMAGNPAISIPCGFTSENLPVGLQIVGPWFGEKLIFQAAAAFEWAKPWAGQRPPL